MRVCLSRCCQAVALEFFASWVFLLFLFSLFFFLFFFRLAGPGTFAASHRSHWEARPRPHPAFDTKTWFRPASWPAGICGIFLPPSPTTIEKALQGVRKRKDIGPLVCLISGGSVDQTVAEGMLSRALIERFQTAG